MGYININISESYLSDQRYIDSFRACVAGLGVEWRSLTLREENVINVPAESGLFLLVFQDYVLRGDISIGTKSILYVGGSDGVNLRDCFCDLLSIFNDVPMQRNLYSQDMKKFRLRHQAGDLIFYFLPTTTIEAELVANAIQMLKISYQPLGNKLPTATLDRTRIEPAF